jgi:hypothetical protein
MLQLAGTQKVPERALRDLRRRACAKRYLTVTYLGELHAGAQVLLPVK